MGGQKRRVFHSTGRQHGTRRQILPAAAAVTIGVMTLGALVPPAASAARPDALQQSLNALVRDGGTPSASAGVKCPGGRNRTYTAGIGDLATGAPVPVDGQVRI